MKTQVLIIGAGPTGLSLANQLIRYGIDFVIVDKKEDITTFSKALVVHARSLEIYEQLGIAQKAVELGQIMNQFRILNDGKIRAEIPLSDIGKGLSQFPFALILEQSQNEEILYNLVKTHNKEVLWQTELESLSQNSDGVAATFKSKDKTFTVNADYLVGCDGASSKTRHLLNLNFEGSTIPRTFYVADVEMQTDLPRNMLNGVFGTNSFVLLMPMKGEKHWRLIGNLPEDTDGDGEVSYQEIEAKVKDLTKFPIDILQVYWFSSYKIHTRHAEKFSSGRCFLAGDACHVHTPAGGQGMNTGIQDAYNLAWKISFVLKGLADTKLLETYNEERLANAIRLLKTTDEAFELLSDEHWYFRLFREKFLPIVLKTAMSFDAVKQFVFPTVSQIGISYHKESLSQHNEVENSKIKAGNRFPYFEIEGKCVFDFLKTPKFHIVAFGGKVEAEIITKYDEIIDYKEFELDETVKNIFEIEETFYVLVRPDNYISLLSTKNIEDELESYFEKHLAKSAT
jgi:2-polyprenyl-6-methoxyphenol hydroxylase-like FAD-dependent oxidoreductase